jgi:four helix bundle protein
MPAALAYRAPMQDFRKLLVWRRAHRLALWARRAAMAIPRGSYGSLKLQLIRAAESIPNNIVEGCGADTPPEFARFLGISIRSSSEVEYLLLLARDAGAMRPRPFRVLTEEVVSVRKMLFGLRRVVLAADAANGAPSSEKLDAPERPTEGKNPSPDDSGPTTDDSD